MLKRGIEDNASAHANSGTPTVAVIKLAQKDYQKQTAAYAGQRGQTAEKMWKPAEI